ncbi:MAG: tetratricopeptide repeat protein, partial [Reinekea sp.]|nr:tetratricopeptide repeat protein [Reinekea sp.]
GNFRQSFADIEQTIALEPRHFGAWSGMGLMFEQLGQIDAAIKAHQAVLDIYPASPFSQMKVEALTKQQRRDSI